MTDSASGAGVLAVIEQAFVYALAAGFGASIYLARRNHRLCKDLRRSVAELTESRKRILAAQDAERRLTEQHIHDGAQQHLVAMSVKLGLAGQILAKDPGRVAAVLEDLRKDTGDALESLRALARDLFPHILQDKGLACAVHAHLERMRIPAVVKDELGDARFSLETESSVYFALAEALRNADAYGDGMAITVRLWTEGGNLMFSVSDLGPGSGPPSAPTGPGLHLMRDRLAAVGGDIAIDSAPGRGTTICGTLPFQKT